MKVNTAFDSGNIEIIIATEPSNIELKINKDNNACTRQWFYFHLETQANITHKISMTNAGNSTFANSLTGYEMLASYDQDNWFRIHSEYDGQSLVTKHTPEKDNIYYAYFVPYSYQRHQSVIAHAENAQQCKHKNLGATIDGHSIDLLVIGEEASNKNKVWVIGRQHPGETMAQWFIEGLITRLLSHDELSEQLLTATVFYIVPNMNPDGAIRGNHRTNAAGVNLNRVWHDPSKTSSPEVYYVQKAMQKTGVDFFIDVHGDEEIPYSFIMHNSPSESLKQQATSFKQSFEKINTNFQTKYDYSNYNSGCGVSCCGSSCSSENKRSKATDFVEDQFGCLSLLLEMPFKDIITNKVDCYANPQQRCIELGESILQPILEFTER